MKGIPLVVFDGSGRCSDVFAEAIAHWRTVEQLVKAPFDDFNLKGEFDSVTKEDIEIYSTTDKLFNNAGAVLLFSECFL